MNTSEHTRAATNGGQNGGQNHSGTKRIGGQTKTNQRVKIKHISGPPGAATPDGPGTFLVRKRDSMSQITELGSGAITVTDHPQSSSWRSTKLRPSSSSDGRPKPNYLAPAPLSRRPSIERAARAVSDGMGSFRDRADSGFVRRTAPRHE